VTPRLLLFADARAAGGVARWEALLAVAAEVVGPEVRLVVRVVGVDPAPFWPAATAVAGRWVAWRGRSADARRGGFGGVHWPDGGADDAAGLWVTAAVHGPARVAGADALVLAPVWAPRSKDKAALGGAALAEVVAASPVPVLALGGVTPARVAEAAACGAAGVASLGGWCLTADPAREVAALVAATRAAWPG
jgi:thiamine-phosphate pyrophosphorylase